MMYEVDGGKSHLQTISDQSCNNFILFTFVNLLQYHHLTIISGV